MNVYYNDIDPHCCAVLHNNIERGYLPQGDVDGRDIRTVRAEELVGYRHIHLFAGIGGFPFGIGKHLNGYRIVTGGFPCQPHSLAGKRKASEDERDLWPETFRIIRDVKPDYVLGENVLGLLSSENGRFFGHLLRDLASIGYDAQWFVLRASDFGAPHQRARVFLVAYPNSDRQWKWPYQQERGQLARTPDVGIPGMAHSDEQRCQECNTPTSVGTMGLDTRNVSTFRVSGETQCGLGGMSSRLSDRMDRPHRWPARPGEPQHDDEPPRVIRRVRRPLHSMHGEE